MIIDINDDPYIHIIQQIHGITNAGTFFIGCTILKRKNDKDRLRKQPVTTFFEDNPFL